MQVQHAPLYINLAFACKTETLCSLQSHALLIPLKSSKSKQQEVHEQKFKDLSSTCQVSVEMCTWLRPISCWKICEYQSHP